MVITEIEIPDELDPEAAAAIQSHVDRLLAAQGREDLSDVVGCAKELAESVARVILTVRGNPVGDGTKFNTLVKEAHSAIDRQPGVGLATDPEVRNMAQAAKSLVDGLGDLRNRYGTGHGRAKTTEVLDEHAEIAVDAVTVWARWALRRLPAYLMSDVADLIRRLDRDTFRKGDLRDRLEAVNLYNLDSQECRGLGAAVGRRTVRETVNVRNEGAIPAVSSPELYPYTYRIGLVRGLLFNADGALSTTAAGVNLAADLLCHDDLSDQRGDILEEVADSSWIAPLSPPSVTLESVTDGAITATRRLPADVRDQWKTAWSR